MTLLDFGTGYSSLSYLKRFPVDELKIDRSFIRDLPDNHDDVSLVETIIAMAHKLDLDVVAEGVENWVQCRFLRERGCALLQGYLFGRPQPGEIAGQILADPGRDRWPEDLPRLAPARRRQREAACEFEVDPGDES